MFHATYMPQDFVLHNWPFFLALGIIDITFKGIALWKAAQGKQKHWFIAMIALNTAGVLPHINLSFFQKTKKKK
jgi:hypothetical protein